MAEILLMAVGEYDRRLAENYTSVASDGLPRLGAQ